MEIEDLENSAGEVVEEVENELQEPAPQEQVAEQPVPQPSGEAQQATQAPAQEPVKDALEKVSEEVTDVVENKVQDQLGGEESSPAEDVVEELTKENPTVNQAGFLGEFGQGMIDMAKLRSKEFRDAIQKDGVVEAFGEVFTKTPIEAMFPNSKFAGYIRDMRVGLLKSVPQDVINTLNLPSNIMGTDNIIDPDLPDKVFGETGAIGDVSQTVGQIATMFVGLGVLSKASGAAALITKGGKAAQTAGVIAKGGLAEVLALNEENAEAALFTMLNDIPIVKEIIPDLLVINEDDNAFVKRVKLGLEGTILAGSAHAIIGGIKVIKNIRAGMNPFDKVDLKTIGKEYARLADTVIDSRTGRPTSYSKIAKEFTPKQLGQKELTEISEQVIKAEKAGEALKFTSGGFNPKTLPIKDPTGKRFLMEIDNALTRDEFLKSSEGASLFKTNVKQTLKEVASGFDKDPDEMLVNMARLAGKFKNAPREVYKAKIGMDILSSDIHRQARLIADGGGEVTDKMLAQFMESKKYYANFSLQYKNLRRDTANSLRSFKAIANLDELDDNAIKSLLSDAGGRDSLIEQAKMLSYIQDPKTIARLATDNLSLTDKWGIVLRHIIMNSLLSDLVTHGINIGSTLNNTIWRPSLRIAANVLNPFHMDNRSAVIRSELKKMHTFITQSSTAFKMAMRAMSKGEPILENFTKIDAPVTKNLGEILNFEGPYARKFVNWLGKVSGAPTRALVVEDEFFKQIAARGEAASELMFKGIQKGLDGDVLDDYIHKGMRSIFNKRGSFNAARDAKTMAEIKVDGLRQGLKGLDLENYMQRRAGREEFRQTVKEIQQASIDEARHSTFQTPLGPIGTKSQELIESIPGGFMLQPFVRTPVNLTKFNWQASGLDSVVKLLNKETRRALASNPKEHSLVVGRLMFGSMLTTAFTVKALNGELTGSTAGAGDPQHAETSRNVREPNSIKIGDNWVSLRFIEPLNMYAAIIADVSDFYKRGDEEGREAGDLIMHTLLQGFVKSTADNAWFSGIINAAEGLFGEEYQQRKFLQRLVQMPMPAIGRQSIRRLIGDDAIRDTSPNINNPNWLFNAILDMIPILRNQLPPVYNALGEVKHRPDFISKDKNDVVFKEFEDLGMIPRGIQRAHRFSRGGSEINIDLSKQRFDPTGESVYHALQREYGEVKLRGKTLRQSLESLIQSPRYQKLAKIKPGTKLADGVVAGSTDRQHYLREIMSNYRKAAWAKIAPELTGLMRDSLVNLGELRRGKHRPIKDITDDLE